MEQLYIDHLPLLKHRAKYYAIKTHIDYDELFSAANELFVRSYYKHNPALGHFSNYLKITLDLDLLKYTYTYNNAFLSLDLIYDIISNFYKHTDDYIRHIIEAETLKQFNRNHQLIFNFVFNPTPDQLQFTQGHKKTTTLTKNCLILYLKSQGWAKDKIRKSLYEISKILFN